MNEVTCKDSSRLTVSFLFCFRSERETRRKKEGKEGKRVNRNGCVCYLVCCPWEELCFVTIPFYPAQLERNVVTLLYRPPHCSLANSAVTWSLENALKALKFCALTMQPARYIQLSSNTTGQTLSKSQYLLYKLSFIYMIWYTIYLALYMNIFKKKTNVIISLLLLLSQGGFPCHSHR